MAVVFSLIARTGKVLNVHGEHKPAVDEAMGRVSYLQKRGPMLHDPSRPIEAEMIAVRRTIDVGIGTGVYLNFPPGSGGSFVQLIGNARAGLHERHRRNVPTVPVSDKRAHARRGAVRQNQPAHPRGR
jgi:dihydroorotase-like cyclic amidohydrolase